MKRVIDYVEHLKTKPHHVRERIAFSAAGAITLVIAVGWLTALSASGKLALDIEHSGQAATATVTETKEDFSNLVGAAAAFQSTIEGKPALTIVETNSSSTIQEQTPDDRTVIPF